MISKISSEVKISVLEMFKNGAKKSEIATRYGISPRSVGRIIDSEKQGVNCSTHFPTESKSAHVDGSYVVQDAVINVMQYIRRELKGVEALTYLVESSDSPEHLELYRQILVRKLKAISWWQLDASTVKLGVHKTGLDELNIIHKGERGMMY